MKDYAALWEEIDDIAKGQIFELISCHERTLDQLRTEWKLGARKTKEIISELIKDGKMGSRQATGKNGRVCEVYFPIKKTPSE